MHYSFHSTPTCTFKSRTQTITKANQLSSVPGPADYTIKKPLHKSGTIASTTETRNLYKKFQPNPGPGTYQAPTYITQGVKRSMSAKFIDYTKHSPGPQDYEVKTNQVLNRSPVQTLGYKSKSSNQIIFDHNTFKPGPTQYENKTQFVTKHGTFIGSSHRQDLTETQKTPAPNYYMSASAADFASVANPRCKIGSEFRKTDFNKAENTPGPAVYEKKTFIEQNQSKNKGYSCRQRVNDLIAQELSKMPAPGQYQSHLKNKTSAPRCTTTQTKRKTFMDDMQKSTVQLPGPGAHEPAFKGTKYRSTSANIFSKSNRKPLDQNEKTPGPAQYAKQKKIVLNSAPKYSSTKTIAKNQFLAVNPENPGPGQYNAKISLVKPGLAISQVPKQKRPDFEKHRHTPGPGFYNLRGKQEGPTWKFPSEKRVAFTDLKSQSKNGTHYELASKVVDPPTYMNVDSKIKFSPGNTGLSRT